MSRLRVPSDPPDDVVHTEAPDVANVAVTFQALGHPTRIRVLLELEAGQSSPAELTRRFADPAITLASLAYHVRGLAGAGLIELASMTPRRGAIEHSYALTSRGRSAIAVVETLART